MKKYDFSGWATKFNVRCADGRTIMPGAFSECDGKTVPVIWGHDHSSPDKVLGHALLECKPEGVYTYVKLNDTKLGKVAKRLVAAKDITAMSIFANKLSQEAGNVVHGVIREVSLVLAGANPDALMTKTLTKRTTLKMMKTLTKRTTLKTTKMTKTSMKRMTLKTTKMMTMKTKTLTKRMISNIQE